MKKIHNDEWCCVPNTFQKTYLSCEPNLKLVPLYMGSKMIPRLITR